ncbi:MAG: tRNA dihydrouridine synthase DusB [Christensenellales bacterium]|jgi:nifR3 family TIM-barrel protein|nr:tRNA dihydrouridine synthase DusB [Clostridiales bacterium]
MSDIQKKQPILMLAPLAGISDWPFRLRCQECGADELVTEMVSAMGLLQAPSDSRAYQHLLAFHERERNLTIQLFGHQPDIMAGAAARVSLLPQYKGIDLNFGCPAPKVTGSGSGSALMKNLARSEQIIRAVRKATAKPLSVKMRIGWDSNHINAVDFAKMCEAAGADSLCVHGRTRQQQYAGRADWGVIAQVKQAVSIPVIANGDVFTPQNAQVLLNQTGADGIAIGRGALGNPWLFGQIRQALRGETPTVPDAEEILKTALSHLQDMVTFKGERWALIEMRKHFAWYLKGSKGAAAMRAQINQTEDLTTLVSLLETHFKTLV